MFYNFIKIPVVMKTGHGVLREIDQILRESHLFFPQKVLVTQENLHKAYFEELSANKFDKVIYVKGGDRDECDIVMEQCKDMDVLILGFGGGSVLDEVKFCASKMDVPYITMPSALSNDAIYSPVARLFRKNTKMSFDVQAPIGIIVDIDVVQNSPDILLLAGIADLVSNMSAIQDWRLAFHETGEPINELAYMLSKESATPIFRYRKEDLKSDALILDLVNGLITSGLAMTIAGSTRGASGSEHMISHAIDKFYPERSALHGLQVAWAQLIIEKRFRNDEFKVKKFFDRMGITDAINENIRFTEEEFDGLIPLAMQLRNRYTILNKIIAE